MGIISKIKSVLGVAGDGQERPRDRETAESVGGEPETTSERAVKGVDQPSRPPTGQPSGDVGETSTGDRHGSGTRADETAGTPGEPEGPGGEPVDSIKGIGTAYARRLANAGVHSVADLARAEPEELAAATDLGAGRVRKWIEQAQARTDQTGR